MSAINTNYMRETFLNVFQQTTQQTTSALLKHPQLLVYDNQKGAIHNFARLPKAVLAKITSRNQASNPGAFAADNYMWRADKYVGEMYLDKDVDVMEAIADPTSEVFKSMKYAAERLVDKVGFTSAVDAILKGAPNTAGVSTSFASEGGITVDATAGLDEAAVRHILQAAFNNGLSKEEISNSVMFGSGAESSALLAMSTVINEFYITAADSITGGQIDRIYKSFGYDAVPGSDSEHTLTSADILLPENTGVRTCLFLAPESLMVYLDIDEIEYFDKTEATVDSALLRYKLKVGVARKDAARVIAVSTTI